MSNDPSDVAPEYVDDAWHTIEMAIAFIEEMEAAFNKHMEQAEDAQNVLKSNHKNAPDWPFTLSPEEMRGFFDRPGKALE